MADPADIRQRIGRLLKRVKRRDDYGTLLATGQVVLELDEVDDPKAWRAAIRRDARADRIKVRTGQTEGVVWALLHEAGNTSRSEEFRRYNRVLEAVVPWAVEHRHEPLVALRDGDEAVFTCQRCDSLGYADAARHPQRALAASHRAAWRVKAIMESAHGSTSASTSARSMRASPDQR